MNLDYSVVKNRDIKPERQELLADLVFRAWAEIDLDALTSNIGEIRKAIGPHAEIMAVVKADAYGHGIMETVQTLLEAGATRFAVSMLDEAIQLRKIGIDAPILVLGHSNPARAEEIITYGITQAVYSYDLANALSEASLRVDLPANIHIKIDTGMSRIGFPAGYAAVKDIVTISRLPGIVIEGVFTHFSTADEEDAQFTHKQFEQFESILDELGRIGVYIPLRHASNSAGIMGHNYAHLDLVRAGIILYGIIPSSHMHRPDLHFQPAMSLKAYIIHVKEIPKGSAVSYGRKWIAERTSIIATLPIGYADGYSRHFTNCARVLVNGQYAPIVGTVCMDQCMIDVTDIIGEVNTGDEVVLLGKQGGNQITVEELAKLADTIPYEIVCLIGKRIPRVYLRDGEVVHVHNYLI